MGWLLIFSLSMSFSGFAAKIDPLIWQNFLKNREVKWKDQTPTLPEGFSYQKNLLTGPNYWLETGRNGSGLVNSVTEISSTPLAGDPSENDFHLRSMALNEDGTIKVLTKCNGNRYVPPLWNRLPKVKHWTGGKAWSVESGEESSRQTQCMTVTPALCQVLGEELEKKFGEDFRTLEFAPACRQFAEDISQVYQKVVGTLPHDLVKSEMTRVQGAIDKTQGMGWLNWVTPKVINHTHVLGQTPPEVRVKQLSTVFGMFDDMGDLEAACLSPNKGERSHSKRKPQRLKAEKTKPTA